MAVPIIWLPLNGNFVNNGLDNSAAIICPGAKYADGKIGKCLSIENYQSNTATFNMLNGLSKFSFCCWLKLDSKRTGANFQDFFKIGFIANGYADYIRIEHTNVSGAFSVTFNKNTNNGIGSNAHYQVGGSNTEAKDKWCHITVTNDGKNIKTFINGSLSKTIPVTYIYTTGALNGKSILGMSGAYCHLNDLRIYNEALTQKQIRLISQCLIMHYPLDNNWNTATLYDCSGFKHDGIVNGTLNYQNDSKAGNGSIYFNGNTTIKVKSVNWTRGYKVSSFTVTQWCKVKKEWSSTTGMHGLSWGNDFIRLVLGKTNFVWSYLKYINSSGTVGNVSLSYGSASGIVEDKWYFIAVTFNYGIINLYLDGKVVATADRSSEFSTLYYGTQDIHIGSYSSTSEKGVGSLSDIRAYSSALSSIEILDLYQSKISTDDDGNVYCYGINKKDGVKFWDTGIISCHKWSEEGDDSGGQMIEI